MLDEKKLWDRVVVMERELRKAETRYHAWNKAFKARYGIVPGYNAYPRYQRYAYETMRYYNKRACDEWAPVFLHNLGSR